MKNKFKMEDDSIIGFYISELKAVHEISSTENSVEAFIEVKNNSSNVDVMLTKKDLQHLLSEIEKCEKDKDYYFETYISE
jgi:hypothetical protein